MDLAVSRPRAKAESRTEQYASLCQLLAWAAGSGFYGQLESVLREGAYSSLASNALPVDRGPDHSLLLFSLNLSWVELHFGTSSVLDLGKTQAAKCLGGLCA